MRHIYVAINLKFGKQILDKEECINIKKIPYKKLRSMILRGGIKETTLILAFLLYEIRRPTLQDSNKRIKTPKLKIDNLALFG